MVSNVDAIKSFKHYIINYIHASSVPSLTFRQLFR